MMRSLKAEFLKLFTTRAIYGLLAGEIAVVLLSTASTVMSAQQESLRGAIHEQVFFLLVAINVGLFSLIIGMRTVTEEFRHETIAHSFLADPQRLRTVGAKAGAGAVTAAAFAAVSAAVMILVGVVLASTKGGDLSLEEADASALVGFVVANGLWAVMGVGIGAVVRHQVPAIVGGIIWVLVIENLGSGLLRDAGAYLPGQSAYALAQALDAPDPLSPLSAATLMTSYALLTLALGASLTRRRDVGLNP